MSATDADGVRDQHDHGATPYSRGASSLLRGRSDDAVMELLAEPNPKEAL
jgi:hypothetical protein